MAKLWGNKVSDRPKDLPPGMGKMISKSRELLFELVAIAGSIDFAIRRPMAVLRAGAGAKIMHREYLRDEQRIAMKQLRRQGLITSTPTTSGWKVRLTARGVDECLRQEMLKADLLDDDTMCIVTFDIPETQRTLRRNIGNFLLRSGFVRLHRSVFISPFDMFVPIDHWIRNRKLLGRVVVYRAARESKRR